MASVTPKYSRAVKRHTPAYLDFLNSRNKPVEEDRRNIDILAEHPDLLESDYDQSNDDRPYTLEDEASHSMGFGPAVDGEQSFNTERGDHLSFPEGFAGPSLFDSPSIYKNRPVSGDIPAQQHENGRELPDYFNTSVAYEPSSTLFESTTPLGSSNGRGIPDRFNHDEQFPQYPLQRPSPLECPTGPTAPDFIYQSSMVCQDSIHRTHPREYNNDSTPELYNNTTDLHPYNLSQSTFNWRPNCHGTPSQYPRNSPQSTTSAEKQSGHAMPNFVGRAEGQILSASSTSSLERYFTGEERSADYHSSSQLNRHIYGGDLEPALRASFQSPFDVNHEPPVNSGNESSSANAHEYNSTRFPSWRNSRPLSFGSLRSATNSFEGTLGRGHFPSTVMRPLDSLLQPTWPLGAISTTASADNGYRISDPDPAPVSSSCALHTASTTEGDGYGCSTRYTQSVPDLCAVGIRETLDHGYEDNDPYTEGTPDPISQHQSPAMASIDHEYGDENGVPNCLPDLVSSSSDEGDTLYDVELSSNNPSHSSEEEWVAISNQRLGENTEIERYYAYPGSSWADLSRDIHTAFRRMEPQRAVDAVPLLGRIALERAWEWGREEQQLRNVETVEREDNWIDVAEREYR